MQAPSLSRPDDEFGNNSTDNVVRTSSGQLTNLILRPRGVAGKDYSIQEAMGLATSERNDQKYSAIMVS